MIPHDKEANQDEFKYNEIGATGLFTIDPALTFLQELILGHLRELAFYLIKLNDLGINNPQISGDIIEIILGIIADTSYTQREFHQITDKLVYYLRQSKVIYVQQCEANKVDAKTIMPKTKRHKKHDLMEAIKRGERQFIRKINSCTSEQKALFDIIFFLIKSICLAIMQAKRYNKDYNDSYITLLYLLNANNLSNITNEDMQVSIQRYIKDYKILIDTIYSAQNEFYGPRVHTNVPFSPRQGKAILVSGIDLTELEAVLKATKNTGIDVYTHGIDMLMAHTFEKFKEYPNLVGHFGKDLDNCVIDFAAFPGAVLMSRQIFQKIEYLHRGRLFTTDNIVQYGITKIKDNNLEPLIKAAHEAKGFTKEYPNFNFKVGFYDETIAKKVNLILDKMEKDEIKHLYIVGLLNHAIEHQEYFNNFFDSMSKDCYAFSLAYEKQGDNILHFNFVFDNLFIYNLLDEINKRVNLDKTRITIYIPKCDQYTVTDIIRINDIGIKDIYLCKCPSSLANPIFIEALRNTFGIKEFV